MNTSSEHSSCRPENLTLFHYGELEAADRLRTEEHLKRCASCRRELEQLRSALELLPKGEAEISPEEIRAFNERLSRRLRSRLRPSFRPALGWTLAAATAVLLTVTLHPPAPEPRRHPPEAALKAGDGTNGLPSPELLLDLELLENLDLLQELEGTGIGG